MQKPAEIPDFKYLSSYRTWVNLLKVDNISPQEYLYLLLLDRFDYVNVDVLITATLDDSIR